MYVEICEMTCPPLKIVGAAGTPTRITLRAR
jgi:hypothetical protein